MIFCFAFVCVVCASTCCYGTQLGFRDSPGRNLNRSRSEFRNPTRAVRAILGLSQSAHARLARRAHALLAHAPLALLAHAQVGRGGRRLAVVVHARHALRAWEISSWLRRLVPVVAATKPSEYSYFAAQKWPTATRAAPLETQPHIQPQVVAGPPSGWRRPRPAGDATAASSADVVESHLSEVSSSGRPSTPPYTGPLCSGLFGDPTCQHCVAC